MLTGIVISVETAGPAACVALDLSWLRRLLAFVLLDLSSSRLDLTPFVYLAKFDLWSPSESTMARFTNIDRFDPQLATQAEHTTLSSSKHAASVD